ncbi:hypothetical protein AGMMS49546_09880 [Spirochaetia bacterium]|nr:hypothetical protein AGMMS49546_09880 [Spirochaetia bacterium]
MENQSAWSINRVKQHAKKAFKANRAACVIIGLLSVFIITHTVSIHDTVEISYGVMNRFFIIFKMEKADLFLHALKADVNKIQRYTSVGDYAEAGALSSVYNSVKMSQTFGKNVILSTLIAFKDKNIEGILIAIAMFILFLAFYSFVQSIFVIGVARFYLENTLYNKARISIINFIYHKKKAIHAGLCILYKLLHLFLWSFTIVMLPVKIYAYSLVHQILAENPEISAHDALALSEQMMKGNKRKAFLLDLSFLPLWVAGIFSFGIVLYIYLIPYLYAAKAELYVELRSKLLNENAPHNFLSDVNFENALVAGHLHINYERNYSRENLILLFFAFSLVGWVWEAIYCYANAGGFFNRGTMYGPWIPIYGVGGTLILVLLKDVREHPLVTFILSILICGVIEYSTATVLWATRHLKYWDYTGFFFNIQGRVCLEGLLVFGLGCCAAIYFFAPILDNALLKIPKPVKTILLISLICFFAIDLLFSYYYPRTGQGITS